MNLDDDDAYHMVIVSLGDLVTDPDLIASALVDFGPGFDEVFDQATTGARNLKERIVVNGPDDLPIFATVVTDAGSVQMPVQEMVERMSIAPSQAMAESLAIMRTVLGDPIAVLLLLELVYDIAPADAPPLEAGQLAEEWFKGAPNIHEALFVAVATRDRCVSAWMPFHYGGGSVEWGRPVRFEARDWPAGGQPDPMTEALSVAFETGTIMIDFDDDELELIATSLSITVGSQARKLARLPRNLVAAAGRELDANEDLLRRIRDEQRSRRQTA